MSECIICDKKYPKNILYEDNILIVMLAITPAVNGHIQIFPKEHRTIFEHLEDNLLGQIMDSANKVSMVLFEVLKIHGTNIIINNGVSAGQKIPHFSIDIIPRRNDDGLKVDWELKQASEDNLNSIQRIISESLISIPKEQSDKKIKSENQTIIKSGNSSNQIIDIESKEIPSESTNNNVETKSEHEKPKHTHHETSSTKKYNYYHKQFERIP